MNLPNDLTYGQIADLCNACTTQEQAAELLGMLVQRSMRMGDRSEADALELCRSNIGYLGGYYSTETQKRWEELFGAVHPIFGPVGGPNEPKTAEEAFQMGVRMATPPATPSKPTTPQG